MPGTPPKGSSDKPSFQDALLQEVANSPGSVKQPCVICNSPNRDQIEEAYDSGVTFRLIGRALQRTGEMPANLSGGTIGERVSNHFRMHRLGDTDGQE